MYRALLVICGGHSVFFCFIQWSKHVNNPSSTLPVYQNLGIEPKIVSLAQILGEL